ncbi:ABC transporter permease [Namhaeicola litoreus]|uniref:ABC transporter permease n=1 Tax=Namhaeicola litoreus TaxID=1052145 RepID=A0ABW3Y6X3_9FLAO
MFDIDRWREIFQSIGKNKLRTFLGAFTVALGIFIFTVLFGMGNGLKNQFEEFFMDDATNAIFIYAGRTSKPYGGFKENRRIQFKNEDLALIEKEYGDKIEYISPRIYKNVNVRYKNEAGSYNATAVMPDHQFLEKTIITKGRYINNDDIINKRRYAVIGRLVEEDIYRNEEAIGTFINLNGMAYMVIGVFEDAGGDNEERRVYLPVSTTQLIYKNTDEIDQINLTYKLEIGIPGARKLVSDITKTLKEKHSVARDDQSGIRVRSVFENVEANMQFANVLQLIVLFIGIGTLFAGAIGIGNIMVFVVKERTKELGIRKALGASPKSIVWLILQESIFITSLAGYIGLLIAVFVLSRIGNSLQEYFIKEPQVNLSTVITATIILVVVGAIAGFIPAKRAASIKPIVALGED